MHSRHRDKTIELLDVDESALFYGQTLYLAMFKYIFLALKNTKKKDYGRENILTLVESTTAAIQGVE